MKIALIGYSLGGKSSIAALLSGKKQEGFDPLTPTISVARVTDGRLERIGGITKSKKITPAEFTLLDFKGVPREIGFDEKVILHILDADILTLVLDAFSETNRPEDDFISLCLEFIFRDSERLANLSERRAEDIKHGRRKPNPFEDSIVARALELTQTEKRISEGSFNSQELAFLGSVGLLTIKPIVALANGGSISKALIGACEKTHVPCVLLNGAGTDPDGVPVFWKSFIDASGLVAFFTASEKETRGWLLHKGSTVLDAAGLIHTDMAKGFVRAEVIAYEDLDKYGSFAACREGGAARLEGREAIVKDGDIINIRFSR
jgi:hypothetical protein